MCFSQHTRSSVADVPCATVSKNAYDFTVGMGGPPPPKIKKIKTLNINLFPPEHTEGPKVNKGQKNHVFVYPCASITVPKANSLFNLRDYLRQIRSSRPV